MRFRISDFGFRIVGLLAVHMSALAASAQQCYVDPFTGQRYCTQDAYGRQPAAQILGNERAFPEFNPQSEIHNPKSLDSSAHCRITVGDGSAGSGTLVARSQKAGLVLTCSHLFDGSTSNIEVVFPNGQRFTANIVDRDRPHDLSALVIRRPDMEPVQVCEEDALSRADGALLTACGYGPNGQFRCIRGDITGQATPVGAVYPSLTIRGAVRPGDSGGGVLNSDGKLVGVVWGQRDGMTYANCGRPLREMLDRILGKRPEAGNRIVAGLGEPPANRPTVEPSPSMDWQAWSQEIEARIRALDAAKQVKGDYLRPGDVPDLSAFAKRDELNIGLQGVSGRFESVLERVRSVQERIENVTTGGGGFFQGLSTGKLLVGALGLSGPVAAAMLVAGGLFGSRIRKRIAAPKIVSEVVRPIAVDSPPPPQRTVAETHFVSYETDSYSKAHQWASEQIARKYPGAAEILQAQDSLIKQHLAAR